MNVPPTTPRGLAIWCLRISLVVQAAGLFGTVAADGTPIGTTMFMTWEWPEATMLAIERGAAWFVLLGALASLVKTSRLVLGAIALWFFLIALAATYQGGFFTPEVTVPAHAVRFLGPLALAYLARSEDTERVAEWLLRVGAAATFIAHGAEAFLHHPRFIDYIIAAGRNLLDVSISERNARTALTTIGLVDIAVAVAILVRRFRAVALYMALWGIVTAFSRMVHYGWGRWPATTLRAMNFGVPLALFLLWKFAHRPEKSPDEPPS